MGDEMGNQERGIIGPSAKDVQEVNDPNRQPSFWTKVSRSPLVRGAVGVLGLGTLGVADVSCVSPKTVEVRPTTTPVSIGGPEFSQITDPEIKEIAERLADPQTRNQVPVEQIEKFNNWEIAHKISAEATATAEAQKPKPLPDVITAETPYVTLPQSEVQTRQDNATGTKLSFQENIIKIGGEITPAVDSRDQTYTYVQGRLPANKKVDFLAPVSGKVTRAQQINAATIAITIEIGNNRWVGFAIPTTSALNEDLAVGSVVTLGITKLATLVYLPGDNRQTTFEAMGGAKSGTVVNMTTGEIGKGPDKFSKENAPLLRAAGGEAVTFSTN